MTTNIHNFKVVHHHFNGDLNIILDNTNELINNTLLFTIRNHKILFKFSKIENINTTDKKYFISKIQYSSNFPQDILNLFSTLGMLNTPTVFYLMYNPDFNVYYLKNTTFTTVFMLKK